MRRAALTLVLGLALVPQALAAPKSAVFGLRAAGDPRLGYFVYPMAAGTARHGAVIVSNVGTATGTVTLSIADGTTGNTSGTVYKTDTKATGPGTWVALSRKSLTLKPGTHRTIPFTVRVPGNAKPGQWVAGIVAENARRVATQKPGQKARVQIKIRDLTIVAVQVNVPGPKKIDFAIGDVTTSGTRGFQKAVVHFENRGNVLTKPTGVVTIYDSHGKALQALPFTMDTFLPDTAIDYPLLLKKALGAGDYSAAVRLVVAGTAGSPSKVFVGKPSFSVSAQDVKQVFTSAPPQAAPTGSSASSGTPAWAIAVAAAGAALLLAGLVWLLARRRRRDPRPGTTLLRPPVIVDPAPTPAEPVAVAELPAAPVAPTPALPVSRQNGGGCEEHYWDVAYERGELGDDGVWRFPHRCRNCGLQLLARDIGDASAQARSSS
jgi:hypothetical protein